jgi:hypothetical protein
MNATAHADSLTDLSRSFPKQINSWTAESEDRIFDEKTIFSYINGAAEVYKAYNMRRCLSRRYTAPSEPAIVLDIFDMRSSKDAFGVFTHDTDGEVVGVGQGGRYRPGWLSFWKNRYYISIYTEEETPASEKAVMELGRQIAASIKQEGERPHILAQLPEEGLQKDSIRYLHHPTVLNYHFYIADENILNISPHTDTVLAEYRWDNETVLLLLIDYPDLETAEKSLKEFLKHYLPDADPSGMAKIEGDKWATAVTKGKRVIIILEADSRQGVRRLTESVISRS